MSLHWPRRNPPVLAKAKGLKLPDSRTSGWPGTRGSRPVFVKERGEDSPCSLAGHMCRRGRNRAVDPRRNSEMLKCTIRLITPLADRSVFVKRHHSRNTG